MGPGQVLEYAHGFTRELAHTNVFWLFVGIIIKIKYFTKWLMLNKSENNMTDHLSYMY